MGIQDIIEGKKQWRAHMARVKALPPDYQIVYKEIQRYFFKVGPVGLDDGSLLSDIVDFFEQGVADGKGVLELIGNDVAAFADDLIKDSPTYGTSIRSPSAGNPARPRSKAPAGIRRALRKAPELGRAGDGAAPGWRRRSGCSRCSRTR